MKVTTGRSDATERARAYIAPFEHSADGVLFASPDGTVLAANEAAAHLLGRSSAEICALGRDGIADPTDDRWVTRQQAQSCDGAYKGQLRMLRGDGSSFVADVSSSVFAVDGEELSYVIFSDASPALELIRQARAEIDLAELVVDTLESISDGYFAVDSSWRISYVNGHAEKLLQASRRDLFGMDLLEAFPEARNPATQELYERVVRTGQAETYEAYDERLGLHAEVRLYPLNGGGLGVYFLDTRARAAARQEREDLLTAERAARASAEEARAEMAHRAHHDDLTGLLNRSGLLDRVSRAVAAEPGVPLAGLLIDLDRFKRINDTLGHAVGDQLLARFAVRLCDVLGPSDLLRPFSRRVSETVGHGPLIARLAGDEFVIVLVGSSRAEADAAAARVLAMSAEPIPIGGNALLTTASIGITHTDGAGGSQSPVDLDRLLREADAAMYSAKDAGRGRAAWFDERLHRMAVERMLIEQELRGALTRDELFADYQPAFDLRTGAAVHVEALARWRHPERGLVQPVSFIGTAEESGLINPVGELILARAVAQAHDWAHVPALRVWVNVSPRQLALPGFADLLARRLDAAGVAPERLGIEVTESVMAERGRMQTELQAVHALGVGIAIDDFGTGYSSLGRLSAMPFDVIKIDRSFIAQLGTVTGDALVAGIVTLAHSIGAHVIAEGVETAAQLEQVVASGCDSAAGYFMARPASAETMRWHIPAEDLGAPTDPRPDAVRRQPPRPHPAPGARTEL